MATTTLPRPSRPSLNPPTGPLPSLPIPKSRKNSVGSTSGSTDSSRRGSSASLLPSIAAGRAVSSSALPQRPQQKTHSNSTSSVPTLNANEPPTLPPGKALRKTISIGAFPQPPKGIGRTTSHPPSPLSTSSTPTGASLDQRLSAGPKPVPSRDSSLRKKSPRVSGRGFPLKSPLTSPSLLNGSGEARSVSSGALLNLPSPPQSRTSSAQGSYATSATAFEDTGEEEIRGRSDNKRGADRHSLHKDGKGNVIVSVRVRPDAGSNDGKQELEWEVNAKRSSVTYKGREGGEYIYGTFRRILRADGLDSDLGHSRQRVRHSR